jgi:hypothetical protein
MKRISSAADAYIKARAVTQFMAIAGAAFTAGLVGFAATAPAHAQSQDPSAQVAALCK